MGKGETTYIAGVQNKEVVTVLKQKYPGVDKALLSKVTRPWKYAIDFIEDAKTLIHETFPEGASQEAPRPPAKRKGDGHRYKTRAETRLHPAKRARLQHHIDNDTRYPDVASFVRESVDVYIEERDRWEANQAEQLNMLD